MAKCVRVRGYDIGGGKPGIIVPIVEKTGDAVVAAAGHLAALDDVDMVEWRVDFCQDVPDPAQVSRALKAVRGALGQKPLLFTLRTAAEGGEKAVDPHTYTELNRAAAESGHVDLIDVEMFSQGDRTAVQSVEWAHRAGVAVVGSNHDFDGTPAQAEMVRRLCRMQELGADILKIAVMPRCTGDVLALLSATSEVRERHTDRPLITMSMGTRGVISRVAGEVFGSAMTFGTAGAASAPGQVPVERLAEVLDILHQLV